MNLKYIASLCREFVETEIASNFSISELMKRLYIGRDDRASLGRFWVATDKATRAELNRKIESKLIDRLPIELTPHEQLMYRLRFENAAIFLPTMSGGPTLRHHFELDLKCEQEEYALLWASTVFWHLTGQSTCSLASSAFQYDLSSCFDVPFDPFPV